MGTAGSAGMSMRPRSPRPDRLSLSDVADLRDRLDDELFFSEGVLTPAQERRLDDIAGSAQRKIEWIGNSICDDSALIAGIEHEERRLAERRRLRAKRIERKKEYLQLCMERLGIRQVDGLLCTVSLQRNAVSVARTNQSELFGTSTARADGAGSHVRVR